MKWDGTETATYHPDCRAVADSSSLSLYCLPLPYLRSNLWLETFLPLPHPFQNSLFALNQIASGIAENGLAFVLHDLNFILSGYLSSCNRTKQSLSHTFQPGTETFEKERERLIFSFNLTRPGGLHDAHAIPSREGS